MKFAALWGAFIVTVSAATAADISIRTLTPRVVETAPMVLEFEISEGERDRWVRLRNYRGPVVMNGATPALRAGDRVTSTLALTPYLKGMGTNRVELAEPQEKVPVVEVLPRVFPAAVLLERGRLRLLIENTLDNAANVQVEIAGFGVRDAYVPPESQFEIEFPSVPQPTAEIRLTKFPEAIETGYSVRVQLQELVSIELRQAAKGAMVFGIGPKPSRFQLLEPSHFLRRPKGSERNWRGFSMARRG